jgi:hypothetical protein
MLKQNRQTTGALDLQSEDAYARLGNSVAKEIARARRDMRDMRSQYEKFGELPVLGMAEPTPTPSREGGSEWVCIGMEAAFKRGDVPDFLLVSASGPLMTALRCNAGALGLDLLHAPKLTRGFLTCYAVDCNLACAVADQSEARLAKQSS